MPLGGISLPHPPLRPRTPSAPAGGNCRDSKGRMNPLKLSESPREHGVRFALVSLLGGQAQGLQGVG